MRVHRGVYLLPPEWRVRAPHPFLLVPLLRSPAYVSLVSAVFRTPEGEVVYRHLAPHFFFGFVEVEVEPGRSVLMATPEKAILD